MSFGNFLRRISFDSDKPQTGESGPGPENAEGSGLTHIFAAPSRLFESVNAKTGNLVSDLNQKLDISGKFDSIKQASVGTFEQVYRGTPTRSDSKTSDLPKSSSGSTAYDTSAGDSVNQTDSQRAPLNNPFNDTNKTQPQRTSSQSTEPRTEKTRFSADASTDKSTSMVRRQSTNAGVRPPRPPPPSSSALSRAMSLDETKSSTHGPSLRTKAKPNLEPSGEEEEEKFQSYQGSKSGKERVKFKGLDSSRKYGSGFDDDDEEDGNGDSSASEYGAEGDRPVYKQESQLPETPLVQQIPTQVDQVVRKPSAGSDMEMPALNPEKMKEVQDFLDIYVSALTIGRIAKFALIGADYLKTKESEIQEVLATPFGRQTFVNNLEQESSRIQGLLDTQAIPKLLDQISLLLAECQTAEDFAPAKKLLTTSLLFYTYDPNISTERMFLFSYIKNQPIWQSLRFWNACFFQSLQEARAKIGDNPESEKKLGTLTYDQLKSYLNTMNVFNLHQTIKQEFLRKQADLFNLTDDEFNSLRSVISNED